MVQIGRTSPKNVRHEAQIPVLPLNLGGLNVSSFGAMSVKPPVIENPGNNEPEVVVGENLTTLVFEGPSKNLKSTITDNTNISSDDKIVDHEHTLSTEKNQVVELGVNAEFSNRFTGTVQGSGSGNFTFDAAPEVETEASSRAAENGLHKKTTITGGNKGDSVKFTGKTTVQKANLDLGKGADTVTFGNNTAFVGKSTIDLGPAGGKADKVIFKGSNTADDGKVVIQNFDSKDKLLVNGEVLKQSDLEDGAKIDGIKIEFAD